MSFLNRLRSAVRRARAGATDVATAASLRLDVRNLEGQRDHLLRSMGQRLVRLDAEGRGIPAFETSCREVRDIELSILEKREMLRRAREKRTEEAPA